MVNFDNHLIIILVKNKDAQNVLKVKQKYIYINDVLKKNNINFECQKRFDWLISKGKMSLDFYLIDYNIAIEIQGIQHFEPVSFFGGEENYLKNVERDSKKKELCELHGINILYYSDAVNNDKMINNEVDLINEIKKYEKKN